MEWLVHAMLSNALATTILAVFVAGLARACRRPALVHGLWVIVLLKLITPPALLVPVPGVRYLIAAAVCGVDTLADRLARPIELAGTSAAHAAVDNEVCVTRDRLTPPLTPIEIRLGTGDRSNQSTMTGTNGTNLTHPPTVPSSRKWEYWTLLFFGVGAIGWWLIALVRIVRFQRLMRHLCPVNLQWQSRANDLAARLGLAVAPKFYLVPGRVPPMLWAIGQPRLLVPSELWDTLSDDERATLLIHELAHWKRRDHWVRWLEMLVAGLYWWHPIVWWAFRSLREVEEQCCDAWVVWAMPQATITYAAAVLAALEFVSGIETGPALASTMGTSRHVACLKRRLKMIVQARTPKGLTRAARTAVLALTALVLPITPSWARQHDVRRPATDVDRENRIGRALGDAGPAEAQDKARQPMVTALGTSQDTERKQDREAAKRFEDDVKDLIDKLTNKIGPIADEVRKALDSAIDEVHKTLDKEDLSTDDLRKALEKSQEEMRRAFEQGGPVEKEVREAWERAQQDLREAWGHARDEMRNALRDRAAEAQQHQREQLDRLRSERERMRRTPKENRSSEPEGERSRDELDSAQREVRELRQQLAKATQRLMELERRERESRRTQRPRREQTAPAEPAPPRVPDSSRPETAPRTPSAPSAPATPAPLRGRQQQPLAGARAGRRGPQPAPDARFQDLEEKIKQLLKELEDLKNDEKTKTREPGAGSTRAKRSTLATITR